VFELRLARLAEPVTPGVGLQVVRGEVDSGVTRAERTDRCRLSMRIRSLELERATLKLRASFCRQPGDTEQRCPRLAARWQGDPMDELTLRRNVLEVSWVDDRLRRRPLVVSRADVRRG
jgi:hypothetical protein